MTDKTDVGETVLTVPVTDEEWDKFALQVAKALLNMGFKPGEAFSIRRPTSGKLKAIAEGRARDRREAETEMPEHPPKGPKFNGPPEEPVCEACGGAGIDGFDGMPCSTCHGKNGRYTDD